MEDCASAATARHFFCRFRIAALIDAAFSILSLDSPGIQGIPYGKEAIEVADAPTTCRLHLAKSLAGVEAFQAVRPNRSDAAALLAVVAGDPTTPAIARAPALSELQRRLSPSNIDLARKGLTDAKP